MNEKLTAVPINTANIANSVSNYEFTTLNHVDIGMNIMKVNKSSGTVGQINSYTTQVSTIASLNMTELMSEDGKYIFIANENGVLTTRELSIPYDINSSSVQVGTSTPHNYGTGTIYATHMSPDGTHFYVNVKTGYSLYEYTLSTPFNLGTAVMTNQHTWSTSYERRGFCFSPDGTNIYVSYNGGGSIEQYELLTPWDTTTLNLLWTKSFSQTSAVYLSHDGTNLYSLTSTSIVQKYTLTTPWNITTSGSVEREKSLNMQYCYSLNFVGDLHEYLFIHRQVTYDDATLLLGDGLKPIKEPDSVETITTLSENNGEYTVSCDLSNMVGNHADMGKITTLSEHANFAPDHYNYGMYMTADGTHIHLSISGGNVALYTLSTPYDISTATISATRSSTADRKYGMWFSDDGLNMYYISDVRNEIKKVTLSTPFDPSTHGNITSTSTKINCYSFVFSRDGSKLITAHGSNSGMELYSLSTPWDLTTTTLEQQIINNTKYVVHISDDGRHLYSFNESSTTMTHFILSTPWDLTTTTPDMSLSCSYMTTNLIGAQLVNNDRFFVFEFTYDRTAIYKFETPLNPSIEAEVYINGHYAVTQELTQDDGLGDYVGVKGITADFEYTNIATSTVPDMLTLDADYPNQSKIALVLENDSIHETTLNMVNGVMDVSPITAGEIPLKAFILDVKVEYKVGSFIEAIESSRTLTYSDPILSSTVTFSDAISNASSRTLQTRVTLSSVDDKMSRLDGILLMYNY